MADEEFERHGTPVPPGEAGEGSVPPAPASPADSTGGPAPSFVTGAEASLAYAECWATLEAAVSALAKLPAVITAVPSLQLGPLLHLVGEVVLSADAVEVAVVAEAVDRGVPAEGRRACTAPGWVMNNSRRYQSGAGTTRLVTVAAATRAVPTRDILGAAVLAGRVPVPAAAAALTQMRRLMPDLNPDAVPVVWEAFTTIAATGDVGQVHRLPDALRAKYGRAGLLEKDEVEARRHRCLSRGMRAGDGLLDYLLRVTTEDAAVLEAALSPFTAPNPTADGPDPRTSEQRRAEALLTVIGRGVAAGGGVPARPKSELLLQMSLEDLVGETGAGETVGGVGGERFLSPQAVRRISCGTAIRPVVLDRYGNAVLVGQARRLFSPNQVRVLMLRDGHCSFPGCDSPAAWADAHHLIHWADGGPTDLDNATLLCGFHHHVVHTRRLAGTLTRAPDGTVAVEWDLTRGSYDRELLRLALRNRQRAGGQGEETPGENGRGPGDGEPGDDQQRERR